MLCIHLVKGFIPLCTGLGLGQCSHVSILVSLPYLCTQNEIHFMLPSMLSPKEGFENVRSQLKVLGLE